RTELLEDAGSANSSAIGATEDKEERCVRSRPDGGGAFFDRPLKLSLRSAGAAAAVVNDIQIGGHVQELQEAAAVSGADEHDQPAVAEARAPGGGEQPVQPAAVHEV